MSLLYDAVEIIACLLSYIYSLYVLGIFFPKSASYRIWIIIVFGILYLPLTVTTYKNIPNALMSVLYMLCFEWSDKQSARCHILVHSVLSISVYVKRISGN